MKSRHPDKFSFVSVAGDQITVGLTDPSIDLQSMLPAGLTNVRAVRAVYSEPGTHAKLEELKRQLSAAGLADVSVGVNAATGRIEFLTKSGRAALENAIKSGSIKVDHGFEIVDDEIIASGALYGGFSYNVDDTYCTEYCGGTTGFSLISSTTSARYVSTAGHTDDGRARYHTTKTSTYSSGGTSLSSPVDMRSTYKLDVQYAPPSNATDNPPYPYIWDGTNYVTITNYTYPTTNVTFCKHGRSTGKQCGVHDDASLTFSNSKWGVSYLKRIKNNGTGSKFNAEGDSGAPIYYGNWALGWVHGHSGTTYDVYYTPLDKFKSLQTAIDLIVYK